MTEIDRGQVVASAAEVYDEFFVPALFAPWPPVLLDAVGVERGDRVLDIGCGTGVASRAAAGCVGATGSVVGVDPNEAMLTVARRSTEPVTWRAGRAEDLPFDDGSFDRVISQFAMMFFDDRRRAATEMARVLTADGAAATLTWAAVDRSPGYAAMAELVEELFGATAADRLRAPFHLGDPTAVAADLRAGFADVEVDERPGTARFSSLRSWMHTEIRGWTLADLIDDDGFDRLLAAAGDRLRPFVTADGTVEFAAPALVATARGPRR